MIWAVIASTGPFHPVMDAIAHLEDAAKRMRGIALIDLSQKLPKESEMPTGEWLFLGIPERSGVQRLLFGNKMHSFK